MTGRPGRRTRRAASFGFRRDGERCYECRKINGISALSLLHLVVLSAVQGITEFLPISSSAHLILVPVFTGWRDQGLVIDVAVHVGTLGAVVLYFWRDLAQMIEGLVRTARGRRDDRATLVLNLIVATVPVLIAGFTLDEYAENLFRNVEIIGWATLGFGVALYLADRLNLRIRRIEHLSVRGALLIGLFQVLALIPGTSRSGITMTAARLLGIERADAARFSMLLSIPVIVGAGTLKGFDLYRAGDPMLTGAAAFAALIAFAFALVAIAALMAWLKRASFTPFVIYRIVLGVVLLYLVYFVPGFSG
jgi:undecaprenyl-diphosphatase